MPSSSSKDSGRKRSLSPINDLDKRVMAIACCELRNPIDEGDMAVEELGEQGDSPLQPLSRGTLKHTTRRVFKRKSGEELAVESKYLKIAETHIQAQETLAESNLKFSESLKIKAAANEQIADSCAKLAEAMKRFTEIIGDGVEAIGKFSDALCPSH